MQRDLCVGKVTDVAHDQDIGVKDDDATSQVRQQIRQSEWSKLHLSEDLILQQQQQHKQKTPPAATVATEPPAAATTTTAVAVVEATAAAAAVEQVVAVTVPPVVVVEGVITAAATTRTTAATATVVMRTAWAQAPTTAMKDVAHDQDIGVKDYDATFHVRQQIRQSEWSKLHVSED